jgi:hypothetical protein
MKMDGVCSMLGTDAYSNLAGNPEDMRPYGRSRCRWGDNIIKYVK